MDSFNSAINSASRMCKPVISLVLNLAVLLLIIGVVFPEATVDVVGNVSGLVTKFTAGGLTGLITLLVFMSIMDSRSATA